LRITCNVKFAVLHSYHWLYNDAPLHLRFNDGRIALWSGTLTFARVVAEDEGYYQCVAYNAVGTALSDKVNLRRASKYYVTIVLSGGSENFYSHLTSVHGELEA